MISLVGSFMVVITATDADKSSGAGTLAAAAPVDAPKKDTIHDNAPRIVGAVKFVPDILLFLSGLKDTGKAYFRSAAAVGFMISRSILLINGTKNRTQTETIEEAPGKNDPSLMGKLRYNFHKVTHPNHYPVESGAGVAAMAGIAVTLSGIAQMRNKAAIALNRKVYWEGVVEAVVGVMTLLAEGNVLFGKEKPATPAADDHKKPTSALQKLKDQPVLLSGITQAVASSLQIGLGFMTFFRSDTTAHKKRWQYLAAASIYTTADLIYAFLVRKNEFNSEKQPEKAAAEPIATAPIPATNAQMSIPSATIQHSQRMGMAHESTIVTQAI